MGNHAKTEILSNFRSLNYKNKLGKTGDRMEQHRKDGGKKINNLEYWRMFNRE